MTTDTKAVARWDAGQGVNPRANGKYVLFTDHERVAGELYWQRHVKVGELANEIDSLRSALAASRAEVEGLRAALTLARSELAGLPHSMGYSFTHLPKIDAALEKKNV